MTKKKTVFFRAAFAAYAILMLWLLFGQRTARWNDGYSIALLAENINLIPFRTIIEFIEILRGGGRSHAVINLFGNVIMFVPLGFFLPAVYRKVTTFRRTMLWSAITVIVIEITQLFTLLGSLDIDDLILNLLGAGLGYGAYLVWYRKCARLSAGGARKSVF